MNLLNLYNQLRQNPMQVLQQRYNIPQGLTTPDQIIQHLLNTGQVSQDQVNRLMGMRNNPMIKNLLNMK